MFANRRLLFWFAFLVFSGSALSQTDSATHGLLVGKWRHTTMVRVIDGKKLSHLNFDGSAILEFTSAMTWQLNSARNKSAGTYRWLDTGQLETTTLESGLLIQIGTVSRKEIRVDSERLNIITIQTPEEQAQFLPPPAPGLHRPPEVMLTSIFTRVPSE